MILLIDISLVTPPNGQEHYWRTSSMDDLQDSTQQKIDSFFDFSVGCLVNKRWLYLQLNAYNNFLRARMGILPTTLMQQNAPGCYKMRRRLAGHIN